MDAFTDGQMGDDVVIGAAIGTVFGEVRHDPAGELDEGFSRSGGEVCIDSLVEPSDLGEGEFERRTSPQDSTQAEEEILRTSHPERRRDRGS